MPAAAKKNANQYDPTKEPVDDVAPDDKSSEKLGSSDATSLTLRDGLREPDWLAVLREVATTTPTKYPSTHYVTERIADTGRVLTIEQSTALQRITDYVMANHPMIATRGDGGIPAHKRSHATIFIMDLLVAMLDELDAEASGASGESGVKD